jgi:hypothetical protein
MRFCISRAQKCTGSEKLSGSPAILRKLWPRSICSLALLSSFAMISPVANGGGSAAHSRIASSPL